MQSVRLLDLGVSHVKVWSGEITVREKQSRPRKERTDSEAEPLFIDSLTHLELSSQWIFF